MTSSGRDPIVALHGFLGLASDWRQVGFTREIQPLDLWPRIASGLALPELVSEFSHEVTRSVHAPPVLLGYSMGGRLAMQMALARPEVFRAVIFVAAHPGLLTVAEREARLRSDQGWAARFRSEPWDNVVSAWNAQSVLKTPATAKEAIRLVRRENDFDRQALAQALDGLSLGRQDNLRAALERLSIPVLFISGADDAKFTRMMSLLHLGRGQKHVVIPDAGHRVPWDNSQAFTGAVEEFIDDLGP
jgi:2-succinyl-6-hydroxy-2,4-cyclohexadiene-1-carboxylate synthase